MSVLSLDLMFPDGSTDYDYDLVFDHQNSKSSGFSGFSRYEEFLSRELPRQVRRELEMALDQELEPIEDRLKSQLVEIVRSSQEKLSRLYQNSLRDPHSAPDVAGHAIPSSGATNINSPSQDISNSLSGIDVDEQLEPYLAPPYSAADPWAPMNEGCNFPWQFVENGGMYDSGYQSLDWLSQSISDPSRDRNSTGSSSENLEQP